MFLVAANNARKNAELQHNFEYARFSGSVSIDGVNGGDLATTLFEGDTGVNVSGSLSPDATGSYNRQGEFNGQSFFLRLTSDPTTSYALWYDTGSSAWVISPFTYFALATSPGVFTTQTGVWTLASTSASPSGTYVSQTPGYTGSPVVSVGSTLFSEVKEITSISYMRADGIRIPMDFSNPDVPIERDRTRWELGRFWAGNLRYPGDSDILAVDWALTIYQRGRMLYRYPRIIPTVPETPLQAHLEGFAFLLPYTSAQLAVTPVPSAPAEDFLLKFGSDYMKWAIICELNYLYGMYVQREEGNLGPPEQAKAAAWENLLLWDSYMVDSHTTRSR